MSENVRGIISQLCWRYLTLQAPTPQNGQTHSNNSLAVADELLSVFDHFVELALGGLTGVKEKETP